MATRAVYLGAKDYPGVGNGLDGHDDNILENKLRQIVDSADPEGRLGLISMAWAAAIWNTPFDKRDGLTSQIGALSVVALGLLTPRLTQVLDENRTS